MLSFEEIKTLMKEMDSSSISEFKFEEEGTKITLRKSDAFSVKATAQPVATVAAPVASPAPVQAVPAEKKKAATGSQDTDALHKVTAPMVGTFYSTPSPDAEPYVKNGSKVDKKTIVCTLEAMKLFNEIEADCKGTIVEVLAADGQLVEFGQPLFLVKED
ncbi:acetyl-CoA carboxylase biotin carboxyl carrier protein [Sporolactobacillus spathodeae]|uniref:Biotin carboxyl carrier protein of acetyl-CoA carboxylase n=1 Tax=Sporolactobacillus spathodeae TaxID=1465502 RepID=A0ABS2QBK3_9BACL|nr:acetyl-CoA carboxylase biotin carboxyl carrier protein [Sporolactobacillus spathodeae]